MGALTGEEPDQKAELRRARKQNLGAEPRAHAMWRWSQARGVNIPHLAVRFCIAAPSDGIVMFGPADKQQVDEGYEAASAEILAEIWGNFEAEFGISAIR